MAGKTTWTDETTATTSWTDETTATTTWSDDPIFWLRDDAGDPLLDDSSEELSADDA